MGEGEGAGEGLGPGVGLGASAACWRAHSIARARRCMVMAARYGAGGRRRFFLAARPAGLARNFASWRKRRCTILAALAILARCRVSQPRANDCMCIAASTCSSSPVRARTKRRERAEYTPVSP